MKKNLLRIFCIVLAPYRLLPRRGRGLGEGGERLGYEHDPDLGLL